MAKLDRNYTISELAREFGVTPRALRFYEDKGLLSPRRAGIARVYSGRDRVRLKLIVQGKRIGFPLAEIRELLDLYDLGDGQRAQMAAALKKFRSRLTALVRQQEDVADAIESVQAGIAHLEARLAEPAHAGGAAQARAYEQEAKRRLEEV